MRGFPIACAVVGVLAVFLLGLFGTKAMADDLRPIEDIRPGDLVWSFDEATGFATLSPVVRTFESEADEIVEITIGDETIRVTPEHPFWVDGLGWMPARDLREGLPVLARDGGVAAAALVRSVPGSARIFNLEVAGTHTYVVSSGGYVVHNACIWSFIKNTVFRVEKNAFKYPKTTGLNAERWHFHLVPGKELMKHHLPHEWRGWIGNLKSIIRRRWR